MYIFDKNNLKWSKNINEWCEVSKKKLILMVEKVGG